MKQPIFCAGVFFAVSIGIPTGTLMGKNRLIYELLLPWVNTEICYGPFILRAMQVLIVRLLI